MTPRVPLFLRCVGGAGPLWPVLRSSPRPLFAWEPRPLCGRGSHDRAAVPGYFTLTAVQAASTVFFSVLSAPYRSVAAFTVALRAAA